MTGIAGFRATAPSHSRSSRFADRGPCRNKPAKRLRRADSVGEVPIRVGAASHRLQVLAAGAVGAARQGGGFAVRTWPNERRQGDIA